MFTFLYIFRAEVKRYFTVQWSHVGDNLSWFAYTFFMFAAIVVILNGVSGGDLGGKEQLLIMVGWITWIVAGDCMMEIPAEVSNEAETGTLEQLCLNPVPLSLVLALRSVAYFLGVGAKGVIAAVVLIFFITPLSFLPALFILFFLSLIGAYGMGYMFGGIAMVFKRVSALTNLVFSLMIFLTGAFVGLESFGWVFHALRFLLPLTWGISLMRSTLVGEATLFSLIQSGELFYLALHSLVYLALGLTIFILGYRRARIKGTLAHY
ncbi:MAG: ABC transporter permease [Anaerolineales bacterium]